MKFCSTGSFPDESIKRRVASTVEQHMQRPWVAGSCLLCVILLETVDGVLTMKGYTRKWGGICVEAKHLLKLLPPATLAQLGHFPSASQAGRHASPVFYVFLFSLTRTFLELGHALSVFYYSLYFSIFFT